MSRTHLLATGRAFLFDMDGTILDSNAIVEKLWRVFAKRHNLDADDILSFPTGALHHHHRTLPTGLIGGRAPTPQ